MFLSWSQIPEKCRHSQESLKLELQTNHNNNEPSAACYAIPGHKNLCLHNVLSFNDHVQSGTVISPSVHPPGGDVGRFPSSEPRWKEPKTERESERVRRREEASAPLEDVKSSQFCSGCYVSAGFGFCLLRSEKIE